MRDFNYSKIKEQKWDSEVLSLIAAIYKYAGKQELYLKQRPDELEKLVEIAKIQSTESSNAIEGIVTTNTRIKQLVEESTTDVVKAVDRDNVGVTVDTFHFHEMCSRLEDLKAADGKKIFAYHLNDCEDLPLGSCGDDKRLWPGEGVVDHAGIAAALKEIGFDGVCTIEEFRPEYYAMSHEDNVKKAAEVTRDFVQKYFG